MQAMAALLQREWREHLFGFGWTPVILLGLLVLVTCLGLAIAGSGTANISYSSEITDGENTSREEFEFRDSLISLARFVDYDNWSDAELSEIMDQFRISVARPFQYVYLMVAIFVLLGSMYEDRRDRTVLFWKSMPVSDTETVLSKLIAAAWVAPVAVIAAVVAAQVLLMAAISVLIWAEDLGSVARLWWNSGLLTGVIELAVGYLIQGLWALPLYAWLLAVSAAVPRVPFVWALLAPVAAVAIERVAFGTDVVRNFAYAHTQFAALPRPADTHDQIVIPGVGLADQFGLLVTGQMWSGGAIGMLLLWAAIFFRSRNNDL
jgi:ABC-2 type transport system permease protein